MATVAQLVELNDTNAGNILGPLTSTSVTPTAGDQLVVFATASGCTDDTATLTESAGGGTYTQVEVLAWSGVASRIFCFVRDTLVESSPPSRTFSITFPADAPTGITLSVQRVIGLTLEGAAAVRQAASFKDVAATTPAVAMDFAIDTANPVIAFMGAGASPPGVTLPTGFSSVDTHGYTTPTIGSQTSKDESGNTSSTVTWGSSSAQAWGAIVVELDTTAAAPISVDLTLATVTHAAQPLSYNTKTLTLAAVSHAAQPLTFTKPIVKTLGIATVTHSAQPVTFTKTIFVTLGLATVTHTAVGLSVGGPKSIATATVTHSAQPLTFTKTIFKTVGIVTVSHSAQAVDADKTKTLGLVTVAHTAQPLDKDKALAVVFAAEADQAGPLTRPYFLTPALEADLAVLLELPPSVWLPRIRSTQRGSVRASAQGRATASVAGRIGADNE